MKWRDRMRRDVASDGLGLLLWKTVLWHSLHSFIMLVLSSGVQYNWTMARSGREAGIPMAPQHIFQDHQVGTRSILRRMKRIHQCQNKVAVKSNQIECLNWAQPRVRDQGPGSQTQTEWEKAWKGAAPLGAPNVRLPAINGIAKAKSTFLWPFPSGGTACKQQQLLTFKGQIRDFGKRKFPQGVW